MVIGIPILLAALEIPAMVGTAVATLLVLTGCEKNKPSEDGAEDNKTFPANRPTDPEEAVAFLEVGPNRYWHDLNLDGKQTDNETIFVAAGKSRVQEAKKFIETHRTHFSPCFRLKPSFLPASSHDLTHPEKNRLSDQLERDIQTLNEMKERPEIYTRLLKDLTSILEDLPHVAFRYPHPDEVPPGFIGTYDHLNNEMVIGKGVPISQLVHEMDHYLTAYRRVSEWSIPYKVKCGPGDVRPVPKAPDLPLPSPYQTEFKFSLDFWGKGQDAFIYNDVDNWKPIFRSLELGAEACWAPEAKAAALADEVRGYLTMSRYLLFRIGFTQQDIEAYRGEDESKREASEQKLIEGLKKHLQGSSLNYQWAHELIRHYFAKGGSSGENLSIFVKGYYTEMQAPGFVDGPNCQE